jgi:hypothetical protein
MRTDSRRSTLLVSLLLGAVMAALPWLHFGEAVHEHVRDDDGSAAHADHAPHHGGQLGMVGDLHMELVELDDRIEVYLSDAGRRPLLPVQGSVRFDDGEARPMTVSDRRLVTALDGDAREATVEVASAQGPPLEMTFSLGRAR